MEGRSNLDLIKGKFDRSAARLEHIASIDGLIDLTAYRLYGLAEEEVAIVEGRT